MNDATDVHQTMLPESEEQVLVRPREDARQQVRPKRQPPYAVIVENDDFHTWPYVIEVLQRVCGHSKPKAFLLTAQVHYTGRASVWTGPLEVAELKRDQIRSFGPDDYAPRPVTFPLSVRLEPLLLD